MSNLTRMPTKKKKTWTLKLTFLTVNFYLLYLLLDIRFLLNSTYVFGIALIINIGLWVIKNKRQSQKYRFTHKTSMSDLMRISLKYLKINKRYLLITVSGLIISTIIISQTMISMSSYKQEGFVDFVENLDSDLLSIRMGGMNINDTINFNDTLTREIPQFIANYGFKFKSINTILSTSASIIISEPIIESDFTSIEINQVEMVVWTPKIIELINTLENANGPIDPTKALYLKPYWQEGFDPIIDLLQTQSKLSIITEVPFKDYNGSNSFANYTIELQDAITLSIDDDRNIGEFDDQYRQLLWSRTLFVSEVMFRDILTQIETGELKDEYMGYTNLRYAVQSEIPDINKVEIDEILVQIDKLVFEVNEWLYSLVKIDTELSRAYADVSSPLRWTIEFYQYQSAAFRAFIAVLSVPLLSLAFFLVYFSLTLVEKRKSRIISIMRIRGSSTEQLRVMQFTELILAGVISAVVGMLLSIPWVAISFKTSGYFEFNNTSIPLIIPNDWIWKVPIIGMLLSYDLNIGSLISLSSTKIDEGEVTTEHKEPFWQRYYLDLIIFSISAAFWIFIRIANVENQFLLDFLLYAIGPWFLLGLFIGSPLVVARYFSNFIGFISDVLWKIQGGLLALATRNMRKNKFSSSRLAALLMMGLMLSFMAILIPQTMFDYNRKLSEYNIGSDIYISNIDPTNSTQMSKINLTEIDSIAEIAKIQLSQNDAIIQNDNRISYYNVLGINPETFYKAGYWEKEYGENSLKDITRKISAGSMGISTKQRKAVGLKVGDTFSFTFAGNKSNYKLATEFDYFPNLVSSEPYQYDGGWDIWSLDLLAEYNLVKEMMNATGKGEYGLYISVKEGYNTTVVADKLHANFNYSSAIKIQDIDSTLVNLTEDFGFTFMIATFQGMLVVTLIVSIIAVAYFSIITLSERKKEIGTFRAIGMVKKQIFFLLVFEGIALLFSGILFGMLSGLFISWNLVYMISGPGVSGQIPPLALHIPWRLTLGFTALVILFTVIAAILPANQIANKQTGSILRAE